MSVCFRGVGQAMGCARVQCESRQLTRAASSQRARAAGHPGIRAGTPWSKEGDWLVAGAIHSDPDGEMVKRDEAAERAREPLLSALRARIGR